MPGQRLGKRRIGKRLNRVRWRGRIQGSPAEQRDGAIAILAAGKMMIPIIMLFVEVGAIRSVPAAHLADGINEVMQPVMGLDVPGQPDQQGEKAQLNRRRRSCERLSESKLAKTQVQSFCNYS